MNYWLGYIMFGSYNFTSKPEKAAWLIVDLAMSIQTPTWSHSISTLDQYDSVAKSAVFEFWVSIGRDLLWKPGNLSSVDIWSFIPVLCNVNYCNTEIRIAFTVMITALSGSMAAQMQIWMWSYCRVARFSHQIPPNWYSKLAPN